MKLTQIVSQDIFMSTIMIIIIIAIANIIVTIIVTFVAIVIIVIAIGISCAQREANCNRNYLVSQVKVICLTLKIAASSS